MKRPVVKIPPLSRFNLPQVLELLTDLGVQREHLIDYLKTEKLKAVCFPFRQEPDREVAIEPQQWNRLYPDDWDFPIYDGWIGDTDYEGAGEQIPLHVVPDEVDELLKATTPDNQRIVTAAPVYVLSKELRRFVDWLTCQEEQDDARVHKPLPITAQRERAGRPPIHDYTEIDQELERIVEQHGRRAFDKPGDVIRLLRTELGNSALPHEATLRNHIKSWVKRRVAR